MVNKRFEKELSEAVAKFCKGCKFYPYEDYVWFGSLPLEKSIIGKIKTPIPNTDDYLVLIRGFIDEIWDGEQEREVLKPTAVKVVYSGDIKSVKRVKDLVSDAVISCKTSLSTHPTTD